MAQTRHADEGCARPPLRLLIAAPAVLAQPLPAGALPDDERLFPTAIARSMLAWRQPLDSERAALSACQARHPSGKQRVADS